MHTCCVNRMALPSPVTCSERSGSTATPAMTESTYSTNSLMLDLMCFVGLLPLRTVMIKIKAGIREIVGVLFMLALWAWLISFVE